MFFAGILNYSIARYIEYAVIVFIVLGVFDYTFGWVERKVIAKVQTRHGPVYVGKFGFLQNLADLIKLMAKENITPDSADKLIFAAVPPAILAILIFLVMLIPLYPGGAAAGISLGLIAVFVGLSFLPILIFLGGWSSGNKFSRISAQRSVIMLLGYELSILLVIASVVLASGSYNFGSIVEAQHTWYFAITIPVGLVVLFVAMLAEFERPPFDIREADSELIAGWLTDVGAPIYAVALFIDYTRMFLGSLLIAVLFFGGWLGPVLPPMLWLLVKAFIIAFVVILIRATAVRMKLNRLLRFGWFLLLPLAILNLALVFLLLPK